MAKSLRDLCFTPYAYFSLSQQLFCLAYLT
jgi:hypothetical protein